MQPYKFTKRNKELFEELTKPFEDNDVSRVNETPLDTILAQCRTRCRKVELKSINQKHARMKILFHGTEEGIQKAKQKFSEQVDRWMEDKDKKLAEIAKASSVAVKTQLLGEPQPDGLYDGYSLLKEKIENSLEIEFPSTWADFHTSGKLKQL